jgi:chemotaxis protein methyltransferase CheR
VTVALESVAAPRMSREEYLLLNELITDQFGITFPEHKREILESRLRPRLKALHLARYWDYYLHLHIDLNGERARLAEAVTNNETYFFRETHQFEGFFAYAGSAGRSERGERSGRALRVLCAGCSSGEEPYTIGIFARQSAVQLAGRALEIDAFDIDSSRISTGERAEYGRSSLRSLNPEAVARYLAPVGSDRWALRPAYRGGVRFATGNILDPVSYPGGPGAAAYDALFCRNVLIYFSEAALRRAVHNFARVLRPGGLLFLGAAESIIGLSDRFETLRLPHTIAYRRRPE